MVIARIADHVTDAQTRAVETAHRAETAGYKHVTVTADLDHATYNITADTPAEHARRIVDAYLGR